MHVLALQTGRRGREEKGGRAPRNQSAAQGPQRGVMSQGEGTEMSGARVWVRGSHPGSHSHTARRAPQACFHRQQP